MIMEEEQRIKALLALEKTKTHGKADRCFELLLLGFMLTLYLFLLFAG
jgi:hypothetical protein